MLQAIIIAGGKGTRIQTVEAALPKALIPVAGMPVIEHQIRLLARYDIKNILILTGYLAEQIETFCGTGEKWGVRITYRRETQPLGTGGCLAQIKALAEKDMLVINGDQIMDFNIPRMFAYHVHAQGIATLFLHPNDHPYDSDLIELDANGKVRTIRTKPHPDDTCARNLVNAGVYMFKKDIFEHIEPGKKQDLVKDVLQRAFTAGRSIYGYVSPEYVKDMGTPDRFAQVAEDILSGKVARLNLMHKRPAVFIAMHTLMDTPRNGLAPQSAEAIRAVNRSGYLAVALAQKPLAEKERNTVEWLLGKEHAYIDAVYDRTAPGTIPEQAARELHIDLERSVLLSDRENGTLLGAVQKSLQGQAAGGERI